MTPYDKIRPNYVKKWFEARKLKFKDYIATQMKNLGESKQFKAECEVLEEESKKRPKSKQYMTRAQEKQYEIKRSRELHREKIKALIKMD